MQLLNVWVTATLDKLLEIITCLVMYLTQIFGGNSFYRNYFEIILLYIYICRSILSQLSKTLLSSSEC